MGDPQKFERILSEETLPVLTGRNGEGPKWKNTINPQLCTGKKQAEKTQL